MSFFNLSAKKSGSSAAQKGSKASNTPTTSNSKSTPLQQYAEETLSESRGRLCERAVALTHQQTRAICAWPSRCPRARI